MSLFRLRTGGSARRVAEHLVRELGHLFTVRFLAATPLAGDHAIFGDLVD
jgi:hypothetical protein